VLIAIDFDDTLTADAELWLDFVRKANTRGHYVVCVTARRDTAENREWIHSWMKDNRIVNLYTHYTGLGSKVDYMERIGVKVDIWIDDDPRKCALGH
jgi:hypothetical protein